MRLVWKWPSPLHTSTSLPKDFQSLNEMYEAPASPLTPPPRSVYRAYVTSVSDEEFDQSPLFVSSPQPLIMTSPKPILHQRPLVSRSSPLLCPSSPPPVTSTPSPKVQFGVPSILTPVSKETSATATAPTRPPIGGSQTVPLPNGVSSNSVMTTASAPNFSTPKPYHTPPPTVPSPPLTKSLRQKAFERSQNSTPTHDQFRHERQKASTGQRMKESVFFALVILPMSCWYTRGGKMIPGQNRLVGGPMVEDDDTHSVDSRAPRMIGPMKAEITPPETPTKARRMSDDGYRRRDSLSSANTPKRDSAGEIARRMSFDGKATTMRGRRDGYKRTASMSKEQFMDLRDEHERLGSMSREQAMVPYEEPGARSNTPYHRRSFGGKPMGPGDRERGNTHSRQQSFDSHKALVYVPRGRAGPRRDSFEYPRSGSMARQQPSPNDNYKRVDHDRMGSFSQRGRPQEWAPSEMQMQRYAPAPSHRAAPMTQREWEWEREQDRRREPSFISNKGRVVSMGMPPPVMGAERWV